MIDHKIIIGFVDKIMSKTTSIFNCNSIETYKNIYTFIQIY